MAEDRQARGGDVHELAKRQPQALERIVVHEMTYPRERHHGERFTTQMDGFLPDWPCRRDDLNAAPLASEDWPD